MLFRSEINTPRLMAAAKEFNIGKDTLIEFLVGKGFSRDDLKPTAKLSEDMYRSLIAEFASDKAVKQKSDQIEIPKGGMGEARKKKEEEEILFKKGSKKTAPKEEKAAPTEAPAPAPETPTTGGGTEITKVEAPEIEGPKIVSKIDLDKLDSSTRPKKTVKSSKSESAPETPEAKETPVAPPPPEKSPADQKTIENIKAEILEGPKILGKIELPVQQD